ncbi:hypothetical protein I7I52_06550 [Histoplasma capsulatum]|uniref:Uncharacterized protein n=1 Tax=Ajellomyces capsulatus TaxID=5037 RepID=A0A8H7YPE5_AJECA|nr:hypothetical protein I7I52_06550 [Histoplasma capsulatum]
MILTQVWSHSDDYIIYQSDDMIGGDITSILLSAAANLLTAANLPTAVNLSTTANLPTTANLSITANLSLLIYCC